MSGLIRKVPEVRDGQPIDADEVNAFRHFAADLALSDAAGIDRHILPGGTTLVTRGRRGAGGGCGAAHHGHSDTWDYGYVLAGFCGPD